MDVDLPAGIVGNPLAVPRCSPVSFAEIGPVLVTTGCPPDTQIGYLNFSPVVGGGDHGRGGFQVANEILTRVPLYNLVPPKGRLADFGFSVGGLTQGHIYPQLDPSRNYAITALVPYVSSVFNITGAEITLWGVPADPAHDSLRYLSQTTAGNVLGAPFGAAPIRPLLTLPMDCGITNQAARITVDSYQRPGDFSAPVKSPNSLAVDRCEDPRIRFEPTVTVRPTASEAGRPTGLDIQLESPQRDDVVTAASELYAENGAAEGIATPPLRSAVIEFPPGMTISPAVAQGLGGCRPEQAGLATERPADCPDASKLGSARLSTPLLREPLTGSLYLATPSDNPFGTLMAAYVVAQGEGVEIKLPVRFALDPGDGRITAIINQLPQQPISGLSLRLKGGPRGVLEMPSECGTYSVRSELTSWASPQPVVDTSRFTVGGTCGGARFAPRLSAGTLSPTAGRSSTLVLRVSREDGEPGIAQLAIELPPGLSAALGTVPPCAKELATSGACPAASRIGSAAVSIGGGPAPLWIPEPGGDPAPVFLGGPYAGASYSFVIVVPIRAGPFDLGTVVSRAALDIDPRSARGKLRIESLPTILKGIPIEYRDIRLRIDRPGFVVNPTDCGEAAVGGSATSPDGEVAALVDRFQVGDCAALDFHPRVSVRVGDATGRNGHLALSAVLRMGPGEARLAGLSLTLPAGELLDSRHLPALCSGRLPPERCPPSARLGHARLWSPLFKRPLQGPIYLRTPSHRLPDLLADLHLGQLHLLLHGYTAASGGRLRVRFPALPDVPLSRAAFSLAGGRHGIFVNSEALCGRPGLRAVASLSAHDGKQRRLLPKVRVGGGC